MVSRFGSANIGTWRDDTTAVNGLSNASSSISAGLSDYVQGSGRPLRNFDNGTLLGIFKDNGSAINTSSADSVVSGTAAAQAISSTESETAPNSVILRACRKD